MCIIIIALVNNVDIEEQPDQGLHYCYVQTDGI